jgi:hypothetical protein
MNPGKSVTFCILKSLRLCVKFCCHTQSRKGAKRIARLSDLVTGNVPDQHMVRGLAASRRELLHRNCRIWQKDPASVREERAFARNSSRVQSFSAWMGNKKARDESRASLGYQGLIFDASPRGVCLLRRLIRV